jgi:glycosyltransferase involved in cell wall biosynthesis
MDISTHRISVIILGKLPPPHFGPAIATDIILHSRLRDKFNLIHIDTRLNSAIQTMGEVGFKKIFLTIKIYFNFINALLKRRVKLVLIPIAQETSALIKDAGFILLARLFRKKVVLHLRGSSLLTWYINSNSFSRRFFSWIFSMSNGAIVLGEKLKYIFEPFLIPSKIFVVPNGGDFLFPPKRRHDTSVNLLYVGNLLPGKGLEDVLKAMKFISGQEKNGIRLEVVGALAKLDYEMVCKEIVKRNNLPVNFYDTKSGNEKLQFFADADIFIFTPRDPEGHPWVLVEAMAARLPIISTDQGAIIESVKDRINGFIVEPGRPEQIAEKIQFLIEHPEIRSEMARESRRLYEENFTEEKMIDKLTQAFNTILDS